MDQLREGHARAGHICEYTHTKTGERCSNRSGEGDHFYPYSKEGATTMKNFVSECKWHNQWKGARLLLDEKVLIEERRKTYFPTGVDVEVGEYKKKDDTESA